MMDIGRSKTLTEVNPIKNVNKNPQSFQGTINMQKEALHSHKL